MDDLRIKLPDHTKCIECGEDVPLTETICLACGARDDYRLNFRDFFSELEAMRITDGRLGGLVVGRLGDEDDIPMWQWQTDNFAMVGLMQGGEFLMSKAATAANRSRIEAINSEKGEPEQLIMPITQATSVINTNLMPPTGGLWISWGQYVVNRYATAKYMDELVRLNASAPFED